MNHHFKPESSWMCSIMKTSEKTANVPNIDLHMRKGVNGAWIIRQVLECAAPAALWIQRALSAAPYPPLRRYRVTPRQNPRVFRRDMLREVIRTLKASSAPTANG